MRNLALALLANEEGNRGHICEHQIAYFGKTDVYGKQTVFSLPFWHFNKNLGKKNTSLGVN